MLEPSSSSKLANTTLRIEKRKTSVNESIYGVDNLEIAFPIWIDTPKTDSFANKLSSFLPVINSWTHQNPESFPPVIINITDKSTSPSSFAFKPFQSIKTNDGESLIFNCFLSELPESIIFTRRLIDLLTYANLLPRELVVPEFGTEKGRITPLKTGSQVGNYIIKEKIGEGGVGAVYKARHKLLNQEVAIKVLDHFPNDPVITTAFMQAANYLSQLHHSNIVNIYDYGFIKDKAYMAMEFIEGVTLDKLIQKNLSKAWTEQAISIFIQLLSSVQYAHSCVYQDLAGNQVKGIIHGDIKPRNILISHGNHDVKLADFMIPDVQQFLASESLELRRMLAPFGNPFTQIEKQNIIDRLMAVATSWFGTPQYMPPEQWEGKVSIQSDVFCLGATLYELLTGIPPMSLFRGIKPSQVNPFIPDWIENIIIKSMKIEPSERFNSVTEMEILFQQNFKKGQVSTTYIKEFVMGDKIEFNNTGTVNNNGQLFIGKFNDVYANLNTAGHSELAETLKALKEAIMASKEITESQKQENIEVVNKIGDEAVKEKPNKTIIKALGESLLSTLKSIPDIAKAVAAIAPFITGIK